MYFVYTLVDGEKDEGRRRRRRRRKRKKKKKEEKKKRRRREEEEMKTLHVKLSCCCMSLELMA